jgi:hypothetical protein
MAGLERCSVISDWAIRGRTFKDNQQPNHNQFVKRVLLRVSEDLDE